MDNAFEYVAAKGIELESVYPYKGVDQKCQYASKSVVFKNKGHTDVTAGSDVALETSIANQPTSVAIEAD
jgi:cathepsin F